MRGLFGISEANPVVLRIQHLFKIPFLWLKLVLVWLKLVLVWFKLVLRWFSLCFSLLIWPCSRRGRPLNGRTVEAWGRALGAEPWAPRFRALDAGPGPGVGVGPGPGAPGPALALGPGA